LAPCDSGSLRCSCQEKIDTNDIHRGPPIGSPSLVRHASSPPWQVTTNHSPADPVAWPFPPRGPTFCNDSQATARSMGEKTQTLDVKRPLASGHLRAPDRRTRLRPLPFAIGPGPLESVGSRALRPYTIIPGLPAVPKGAVPCPSRSNARIAAGQRPVWCFAEIGRDPVADHRTILRLSFVIG
jgi:hypothetical protein